MPEVVEDPDLSWTARGIGATIQYNSQFSNNTAIDDLTKHRGGTPIGEVFSALGELLEHEYITLASS